MATQEPSKTPVPARDAKPSPRIWARWLIAAVVVLYVILFMFLNTDRVNVDYVFFSSHSRLIYVIVVSAILGAVAARLVVMWRRKRQ